ncbi:MAG TPA: UDP-glucuronic acid decarboxylase family protein [Planctomycetota bacterium]|nr:UDP-glucuronic acid decarboxylase family protein [Planctomycetota bacterium]
MRIVVTGAAGFLGSHLVDRLLEQGHEIVGIDSLITGSADNLKHLENSREFRFVRTDVTQYIHVPGPVDRVYHFASPASPLDFPRVPVHILKVGALGTLNALGLAKAKNARLLLASTSEVYGDPLVHPQVEGYWGNVNPIGERSMYDEAKRFAEALTMAYHKQNQVETRIVRIFNTYGPRMRLDDGRVLPNFVRAALNNEPIPVHGDGSQTRSFCYVDDLLRGIMLLMESKVDVPVNIGNPQEITVLEFAKEIIELLGSKSQIVYKPLPKDDPVRRRPDITRAKTELGWEPQISRREGLAKTLEDFKRRFREKAGTA